MTENNGNGSDPGRLDAELNNFDLSRMADEILRNAGLDIFGRPRTQENYQQSRFEYQITVCPFRGASRS